MLRSGCGPAPPHHARPPSAASVRSRPQAGAGKIGAAAAGHHGRDVSTGLGRRPQRRRGTGAGTEVADGGPGGARLGAQPSSDPDKANRGCERGPDGVLAAACVCHDVEAPVEHLETQAALVLRASRRS